VRIQWVAVAALIMIGISVGLFVADQFDDAPTPVVIAEAPSGTTSTTRAAATTTTRDPVCSEVFVLFRVLGDINWVRGLYNDADSAFRTPNLADWDERLAMSGAELRQLELTAMAIDSPFASILRVSAGDLAERVAEARLAMQSNQQIPDPGVTNADQTNALRTRCQGR